MCCHFQGVFATALKKGDMLKTKKDLILIAEIVSQVRIF